MRFLSLLFTLRFALAAPPCEWRGIALEEVTSVNRTALPDHTLWQEALRAVGATPDATQITLGGLVFDRDSFEGMAIFRQSGKPGALAAPVDGGTWAREIQARYAAAIDGPGATKMVKARGKDIPPGLVWIVDATTGRPRYGVIEPTDRDPRRQLILPLAAPTSVVDHTFRTPLVDALWIALEGNRVGGVRPLFAENLATGIPNALPAGRAALARSVAERREHLAKLDKRIALLDLNPSTDGHVLRSIAATVTVAGAGMWLMIVRDGYPGEWAARASPFVGMYGTFRLSHALDPRVRALREHAALTAERERGARILSALEAPAAPPPASDLRAAFAAPVDGRRAAGVGDYYRPRLPEFAAFLREHGEEMTSFERDQITSLFRRGERALRTPAERGALLRALVVKPSAPGQPSEFARAYQAGERLLAVAEGSRGRTFTPIRFADLFRRTTEGKP